MTVAAHDMLSERLISQLLQDDLAMLESYRQAEKLQLDQVFATSARAHGRIPKYSKQDTTKDHLDIDADFAFELYVSDALSGSDAAYAQMVQNEAFAANTVDWQLAQRLAANERKISLDAEFARRLQAIDDEGQTDIDQIKDAENVMGDHPLTLDLNVSKDSNVGDVKPDHHRERLKLEEGNTFITLKNKGKGRQLSSPPMSPDNKKRVKHSVDGVTIKVEDDQDILSTDNTPYPICNICMEAFILTYSPINAVLSANSSNRLPFGLRLPCQKEHPYCISCLTSYIQSKLDPDGLGVGKSGTTVFPIRCPECPLIAWPEGIDDDVARRVLGEDGMVQWHHQKLLDSLPRFFCPNPKCSSLLEIDEDSEDPQAACPSCSQTICIRCRTRWHTDLTCEEYQALPADERSPEDRAVLNLAKAQDWRRCPNCSVIVEHTYGCNHMTCRCGFHFCFKCGSPSTTQGKCKSNPPCELWDEERLLEARERERNRRAGEQQHVPDPQANFMNVAPRVPQAVQPVAHHNDLHWINDPAILSDRHWFTTEMIRNLTCGYCDLRLNSLADLRYHLAHVRRHPVYACCGRFFKRHIDFERHQEAYPSRFGYHAHVMEHD